MPQNNRRRGADAEREVARLIGGVKVSVTGKSGPDVKGPDGKLYEVKRMKELPKLLTGFLSQAEAQGCAGVLMREDRGSWYVLRPVQGPDDL